MERMCNKIYVYYIMDTIKNFYIILLLIIFFIFKYIILEYYSNFIINGYIALFISFFLISYIITKSILFSIIIGLFSLNFRIIYRNSKSNKNLQEYNGFSNILITSIGLIFLYIIFINFDFIHLNCKKYYEIIIFILIIINLFFLKINKNDKEMLCYP